MGTTNIFGWTTPNDTDYVAQGYAAIDSLGSSVDTTLGVISGSTGSGDVPKLALDLVTTATIGTAVSSVTVSNCFSSKYDNYKILVQNSDASDNDNTIFIKVNGSTGSQYVGGYSAINTATQAHVIYAVSNSSLGIPFALSSTDLSSYSIDVIGAYPVQKTYFLNGSSSGYTFLIAGSSGATINAASNTAFTLTKTSGTFTGGTIRVYGYRNS